MRLFGSVCRVIAPASLLWLAVSSAFAQDSALIPALRGVEQMIRETDGLRNRPGLLESVAEAYTLAGAPGEAIRLLKEVEPEILANPYPGDPHLRLDVLVNRYRQNGDFDSIVRLAALRPTSHWGRNALIGAGDRERLMAVLRDPPDNLVENDIANAVQLYIAGVAARQGAAAAMQAADEIGDVVETLMLWGSRSYAQWMLSKGWPLSIARWLTDILVQAHREDRIAEALEWARRSIRISPADLEQAAANAILTREREGDESAFDKLETLVHERKHLISILGVAAILRLKRGRVESGARLAARFLNDDELIKEGARTRVETQLSPCPKEDKSGEGIDAYKRYSSMDGFACRFNLTDSVTITLGHALAEARQSDLARIVLDYSFVLGRVPPVADNPPFRGTWPCAATFPSQELAEAYLDLGAKALVREYAEHVAHACAIDERVAHIVARLLALASSPADVRRLLQARSYTSPGAREGLKFGLLAAYVETGAVRDVEALLPTMTELPTVLYIVHRRLPDLATPSGRAKAMPILKASLPQLRETYLTADDRDDLDTQRVPVWMVNYVRAGLAGDVVPLANKLLRQTVQRLNAIDPKNAGMSDIPKHVVGLGTLFLVLLQASQDVDALSIAAQIKDDFARSCFLAVAVQALAIDGRYEAAIRLAEQVPDIQPGPEHFMPMSAQSHAWSSIALALARSGDLSAAFKIAAEHRVMYPIEALVGAFRDGVLQRKDANDR